MIKLRASDERGRSPIDWLDGRHTFSFGDYYDPDWRGFRSLRVINEDRVRGDSGFGTHPHRTWKFSPVSSPARSSTRTAWAMARSSWPVNGSVSPPAPASPTVSSTTRGRSSAAISEESRIEIIAPAASEVLLFDLA